MLSSMANAMKAKFEKYWEFDERKNNILLYVAVVLSPRFKLKLLSYCFENFFGPEISKRMTTSVENVLRRLFHEYSTRAASVSVSSGSGGGSSSASANVDLRFDDETMDLDEDENFNYDIIPQFKSVETTSFDKESEIDVYLLETLAKDSSSFDILYWWKQNGHWFEVLSRMSRDILTIPISTVASESAFSTEGRVVNPSRCSLTPKMVEALICAKNWLDSKPISLDLDDLIAIAEASMFEDGIVLNLLILFFVFFF